MNSILFRALKAGVTSPLLILPSHPSFENSELVSLLGALEELYVVCNCYFSFNSQHVLMLRSETSLLVDNV